MDEFVSVIVPTYNRNETFINAISCLLKQKYKYFEIIVVDQSTRKFPDKIRYIHEHRSRLNIITTKTPNAARARNIAIKKSKGNIIIFIDDDVIFDESFIDNHIRNYSDNSVCAVAGRVIDSNNKFSVLDNKVGTISWYGKFTDGFNSETRQDVKNAITCNASWRKKCLVKIGLFDIKLSGPIREDTDLSLRAIKAGCRIVYDPEAIVQHVRDNIGGYRKNEGRLNWYIGFFKSETYFFLKHWPKYLVPLIILSRYKWLVKCWYNSVSQADIRFIAAPFLGILKGIIAFYEK